MARARISVSRPAGDALKVLGNQIKLGRMARGWTMLDTAARLGVDHRTLRAVEAGSPRVSIGTVFNTAFLVGVNLFGLSGPELARARRAGEDILALLPQQVREYAQGDADGEDDF